MGNDIPILGDGRLSGKAHLHCTPPIEPSPAVGPVGPDVSQTMFARRRRAAEIRMTQVTLAKTLGSSQSKVARMEAGDPSVSLDLQLRSLFVLGLKRKQLAKAVLPRGSKGSRLTTGIRRTITRFPTLDFALRQDALPTACSLFGRRLLDARGHRPDMSGWIHEPGDPVSPELVL